MAEISEVHVLDRPEVVNRRGEILVEGIPGGKELQERPSRHWFDNQAISFLPQKGVASRKLEVSRYPHYLVSARPTFRSMGSASPPYPRAAATAYAADRAGPLSR